MHDPLQSGVADAQVQAAWKVPALTCAAPYTRTVHMHQGCALFCAVCSFNMQEQIC